MNTFPKSFFEVKEYLMDIITEINRLPNYLYAIDIPPYWIILGGEGCKKQNNMTE